MSEPRIELLDKVIADYEARNCTVVEVLYPEECFMAENDTGEVIHVFLTADGSPCCTVIE